MEHEEVMFRLFGDHGLYTSTIGKVEEIMEKRFVKIKLLSATKEEINLPIINVPVARLSGTSSPIKVGDILPVFFSKWAIDEYFTDRKEVILNDSLTELQFDRDNAYALPLIFDNKLDEEFPKIITIHEEVVFENVVSMKQTLAVDGATTLNDTLKVMKKVNLEDELEVKKLIKSLEDVKAVTVSLLEHIHMNTKPGSPTEFSGVPKP